jgi:hypothetical protein
MAEEYKGISTAINLLESARSMRYPDDIRRNITLARSALYDVIIALDSTTPPRSRRGRRSMSRCGTVTITCPVLSVEVATDIELDEASFRTATLEDNQIKCSACGQWHQWAKKDAFLR